MVDYFLELRLVYEDLPDMIELETRVRYGDWSARSCAYTSPGFLSTDAKRLIEWSKKPEGHLRIVGGADTGIGWLVLDFYLIDSAGHARCAVTLATGRTSRDARPAETWRFSIEMRTELGSIEQFARECLSLGLDRSGVARLQGLAI
jgi:hypothetical protein